MDKHSEIETDAARLAAATRLARARERGRAGNSKDESGYRFDASLRIPATIFALVVVGTITLGAIIGRSLEFILFGGIATTAIAIGLWRQLRPESLAVTHGRSGVLGRVALSAAAIGATAVGTQSVAAVSMSLVAVTFANVAWILLPHRWRR